MAESEKHEETTRKQAQKTTTGSPDASVPSKAFFLLNGRTEILKSNETARRILHTPEESLINQLFVSFINNEYKLKFQHHIHQVLSGEDMQSCQVELINSQGEKIPLFLESTRIFDEENELFLSRTFASQNPPRPAEDNVGQFMHAEQKTQTLQFSMYEKQLSDRRRFIEYLSKKSADLIHAEPSGLPAQLSGVFKFICRHINAKNGHLYLLDPTTSRYMLYALWPKNDARKTIGEITREKHHDYLDLLKSSPKLCIVEESSVGAKSMYTQLRSLENNMHISIPIVIRKELRGILGFDFLNGKESWDNQLDNELMLTAQIITNTLIQNEYIHDIMKAKRKAEESDKLKSAFLSNLSHEIRTPINGILGFSEILLKLPVSTEKKREYLSIIRRSSKQLMTIIEDIIDISKVESEQHQCFLTYHNLNRLLDEIYRQYQDPSKNSKTDDIKIILDKGLPDHSARICTDDYMLRRILSNLLDNALKFTSKGSIHFGYKIDQDNRLLFYVEDTGIGIPNEKNKIIFDRFRQVEESETRSYGGTGLGLAICKSFVEKLGGKIWVESNPGHGSQFYFTLSHHTEPESVPYNKPKHFQAAWEGKTILVVDDNEDVQIYVEEILTETKVNVLHAYNGEEALPIIENQFVDIVLLDLQMPVMNGYDACHKIKALKPKLTVIVQSAYSEPSDLKRSKASGCDDFVVKPLTSDKLLSILSKYMK